jgi:hypothetical protein
MNFLQQVKIFPPTTKMNNGKQGKKAPFIP